MIPDHLSVVPFYTFSLSAQFVLDKINPKRIYYSLYPYANKFIYHQKKYFGVSESYLRERFQGRKDEKGRYRSTKNDFLFSIDLVIKSQGKSGNYEIIELLFPHLTHSKKSREKNKLHLSVKRDRNIDDKKFHKTQMLAKLIEDQYVESVLAGYKKTGLYQSFLKEKIIDIEKHDLLIRVCERIFDYINLEYENSFEVTERLKRKNKINCAYDWERGCHYHDQLLELLELVANDWCRMIKYLDEDLRNIDV